MRAFLKKAIPPKLINLYRYFKYKSANSVKRRCHLHELYINNKGDVYPCCKSWSRDVKIGHVEDPRIFDRIRSFNKRCACESFHLIKGNPGKSLKYQKLNIEFSLACQGHCAMCSVDAPSWQGHYDYYDALTQIVHHCRPGAILSQGGEVLVQKKTLEWLTDIKKKYPLIKQSLVTNGNFNPDMVETVERLFDSLNISIVGFQPETYKKIMGMEMAKVLTFSETLIQRKKVGVQLKYLTTPLNFHETSLFLNWAIKVKPQKICISDANSRQYIFLNTRDRYWQKIIDRTSVQLKQILVDKRELLTQNKLEVLFDTKCLILFDITDKWIKEQSMQKVVGWHKC